MNQAVMGAIVTYNADMDMLVKNLEAVTSQTPHTLIYDNGSVNISELKEVVKRFPTVEVIENKKNLGLPINYNRATAAANASGAEWLLILDQDSILPENYIDSAAIYFEKENIAIICPQFRDINVWTREEFEKRLPQEPASYIEDCISSGSLCRVKAVVQLGGFDEAMFIDYVDHDFCKTVIENGYKILQLNSCIMEHQIGESRKISFMGRMQIIYNHSAIRKYYFFRNRMYYARKHRLSAMEHKRFYLGFIKWLMLIFYEKDCLKKFIVSVKGIHDGMKMDV